MFTENELEKSEDPAAVLHVKKCLIDVRGQWRMGRLIRADRKATVT